MSALKTTLEWGKSQRATLPGPRSVAFCLPCGQPHCCFIQHFWDAEGLPDYKPVSVPSRVAVIPLGPALLPGSSDLPESRTERATPSLLFGLAPRGVYPAGPDCSGRGALLPHLFTLTPREGRRYVFCGTFRETRFERAPPAVSRHAALWRPDFPPAPRSRLRGNERLPVRQASPAIITYLIPLPLSLARTVTAR